jgi:hypothetical protein
LLFCQPVKVALKVPPFVGVPVKTPCVLITTPGGKPFASNDLIRPHWELLMVTRAPNATPTLPLADGVIFRPVAPDSAWKLPATAEAPTIHLKTATIGETTAEASDVATLSSGASCKKAESNNAGILGTADLINLLVAKTAP